MKIIKIIKKSIKYIFLIILGVILGLNLNSRNNNAALLHASAEEASTVAETVPESGLDLTQYPSANLIPYPYSSRTIGGVSFSVSDAGVVTCNGTASSLVVYELGYLYDYGKTYYLSGAPVGGSTVNTFSLRCFTYPSNQWAGNDTGNGTALRIVSGDTHYYFAIIIEAGFTCNNLVFKPMLNVGEVAYPFIPSLDAIYNQGYEAGETDGYDQGNADGLDYARAGYWNDSQIFVDLKGMSNGVSVSDYLYISPIVTSNGIDLSNVYTEIVTKYPNFVLTECYFDLQFINSRQPYLDYFKVRYVGDLSLVVGKTFTARIVDTVTWKVPPVKASFSAVAGSNYVADFIIDTSSIGSVAGYEFFKVEGIPIQNISQFKDLRFYSVDTVGNTAYRAGYQAGLNDGIKNDTAYQNGLNEGLKQGELIGYEKAISKGVDGSGLLYALFALLKLFFTLLSDMMSLKIAGDLTIGLFVIGIPAVFMIINIVIKLVNRSSGGKE